MVIAVHKHRPEPYPDRSPLNPLPPSPRPPLRSDEKHPSGGRSVPGLLCPGVAPSGGHSVRGSLCPGVAPSGGHSVRGSLRPGVAPSGGRSVRGSLRPGVAQSGGRSVRGSLRPGVALSGGRSVRGSLHPGVAPSGGRSVRGSLHLGVAPSGGRSVRARLLGAKLSGRIGPNMPGSLTTQTPAQTPARLYGQIPGNSWWQAGNMFVPALLGLPPCMPPHMPYLPNNLTWCITPQMVALAGTIPR